MWQVSVPDTSCSPRLARTTVTLMGPNGSRLADTPVRIEQVRHDFLFGNVGFDLIDHAAGTDVSATSAQLAADYLDLFNAATLPFYLGRFEPRRGEPDTARLAGAARWFAQRGATVKGHPLVWHTAQPAWLDALPADGVEQVLRARIRREVAGFAGTIDWWDAINEVVIMPVFTAVPNAVTDLARQKGRLAMVRLAFEEARAANPNVRLVLNDFDLSSAYECLIEGVLEAGIVPDAIGLQTHMHQGFRGEDYLIDKVGKFARYGIPLHFTETSLVSGRLMPAHVVDLNDYRVTSWPSTPGGEARQADEIVRHYRTLVSQPSVASIVYWGITDAHTWLNAPIGLVRADGSHKPAYDALHGLIKGDWWVGPTDGATDEAGRFELTGFAGMYAVTVGGQRRFVHLDKTTGASLKVTL